MISTMTMEQCTILLLTITVAMTASDDTAGQCVMNVGDGVTSPHCCCSNDTVCATLTDALLCVNDSTVHISNDTALQSSVTIQDVANIHIVGSDDVPLVNCNNSWIKVKNVKNLTIENVKFINCGGYATPSLQIDGCHDVTLETFELWNSTVLSMSNNTGTITINGSKVVNCINNLGKGGGMAIFFNGLSPNNTILTISYTMIFHNKANRSRLDGPTKGGGIYLSLSSATNVTVNITKVFIVSNSARLGGGVYILFDENATNNSVLLSHAKHYSNEEDRNDISQRSRGGGLRVVFGTHPSAGGNNVNISRSRFDSNIANVGSGISLSSNYVLYQHLQNTLTISNTIFNDNSGSIGTGLHAEAIGYGYGGYLTLVTITSCNFQSNSNMMSLTNIVRGMGAVYTEKVPLIFNGHRNQFKKNHGTALVVSSTYVHFKDDSMTIFKNNIGNNGGAMSLVNAAYMVVGATASIQFQDNSAFIGPAIYATSYGEANLLTRHKNSCFIRLTGASNSTASISFTNNTITGTSQHSDIHLPSLHPCLPVFNAIGWSGGNATARTTSAAEQISTPGDNLTVAVIPGWKVQLPLNVTNDEGDNVILSTPLLGYFPKNDAILSTASQYISNGTVVVYKKSSNISNSAILVVQTLGTRFISQVINMTFEPCPPGFQEMSTDDGEGIYCQCQESFDNIIQCHGDSAKIHDSYCIGYEIYNNSTYSYHYIVCPFMGFPKSHYYQLPSTVNNMFPALCSFTQRKGQFCSECANSSLGISVTSADQRCISCKGGDIVLNLMFYALVIMVPTTLLFLVITICSINLTSGPMNMYTFYCQAIVIPENVINFQSHFYVNSGLHSQYYNILFLPLSIWSLGYVEAITRPFCLHPALKTIHVCALGYLIALYPLCLIFLTYCLIELHDRGYRLIISIWKPFKNCLRKWRKKWDTKRSIIDVFAAFLLLSYTKFTNVTISLLIPNPVYNSSGHIIEYRTLADSSVRYNSREHQPFIILASVILIFVIVLPPLFLFLYPCGIWERVFRRCGRRRAWLGVMAFVDTFNGSFKDGTNGTSDCRWFASFYFLVRVVGVLTRIFAWYVPIQRLVQLIMCIVHTLIIAIVLPHKKTLYNQLDMAIFLALTIVVSYSMFYAIPSSYKNDHLLLELSFGFFIFLPPLCLAVYVTWVLAKKALLIIRKRAVMGTRSDDETEPLCESLGYPDRLLNPQDYYDSI